VPAAAFRVGGLAGAGIEEQRPITGPIELTISKRLGDITLPTGRMLRVAWL
jgi:hypothetical protein